eukprot:UN29664
MTMLALYVILFASIIYMLEKGVKNEDGIYIRSDNEESPFDSIPRTMYWCVVTMTSVGYGDLYPIEVSGRLTSVVTCLTGVLCIALPVIIIGGEFTRVHSQYLRDKETKGVALTSIWAYFFEFKY